MPRPFGAASPTPEIRPSDTSTSPGTSCPSTTAAATPSFIAGSVGPFGASGQYHFPQSRLSSAVLVYTISANDDGRDRARARDKDLLRRRRGGRRRARDPG